MLYDLDCLPLNENLKGHFLGIWAFAYLDPSEVIKYKRVLVTVKVLLLDSHFHSEVCSDMKDV